MSTPAAKKKDRPKWFPLVWAVPAVIVVVVLGVLLARWLRENALAEFIAAYPGEYHLPEWAPVGFPAWLAWQHFFNAFFLVLLVRTGLLIRNTQRPGAYWTRKNRPPLKTKGTPRKHSINHWLHFSLDWLWIINGVVFVILLFVTGQWVRVIPTSWEVIPHALSVAVQYASLDWPTENGWVNYNALQQIAYGATIFLAAPLAAITGFRLSPVWNNNWRLTKVYPIELARKIHFPTMIYFVAFVVVHVTLVLTTGAIRNLNHMYAAQGSTDPNEAGGPLGLIMFLVSAVVMVAAWFLVRPMILRPIAQLSGQVTKN